MRFNSSAHPRLLSALTFFLLIVLTLIAARALWALPFYYSDDGVIHLLHLYALDHAIQQGVAYPRWLMDLAFGYGYPLFNFYPLLAAFLGETLHLVGFNFAAALAGSFIVAILVAAFGAYALGRDLLESRSAGLLTATAFIFFPYFFTDLYTRGAVAEALAIALCPWVAWALRQIARTPAWSSPPWLAVFLAAMILAHALTALIAAPALLGYFLLEWLRSSDRRRVLGRVTVGGILGLGLSAFYWAPFIADLPSVRMGRGVYAIQDAFQSNFLPLARLIQPDFSYHYTLAPYSLGATALVIAIGGVTLAWIARLRERGTILYFGVIALMCATLMTESSQLLWWALPSTNLVQFPWRLTLLIGLGTSLAIGSVAVSVAAFHRAGAQPITATILGFILIWSAMAQLDPQPLYLAADSPTLGQLSRYEAYGGFLGTTTWGEYLPAAVRPVNLLNFKARTDAPATPAQIQLLDYSPQHRALNVTASAPFTLTLRTLYNSGWRAQSDGNDLATFSTTNMALLTATIPAGTHQIVFELRDGSVQTLSWWIAAASIAAFIVLVAIKRREPRVGMTLAPLVALAAVFAIPAFAAISARPVSPEPMQIAVSPAARLIGLRIENAQPENGAWRVLDSSARLRVTAFWHIQQAVEELPIAWQFVDAMGNVRGQQAHLPRFGTGVAAGWVPNEVVQDEYDLSLAALANGKYSLQASWDGKTFAPVSFVVIENARPPSTPMIAHPLNVRVGESIRLIGYDAPATAKPSERIRVTLFWRADKNVNTDYTTFVQLLDADDNAVARPRVDTMTGGGLDSPFLWMPGEVVTDRVEMTLPADLRSGTYRLIVGLYRYPELDRISARDESGQPLDEFVTLGELRVR